MKKKVLIIINKFVCGGIETTLLELLNQLDINKYDITIGCMIRGGEMEKFVPDCVKITYLTNYKTFPSGIRRRLMDAFILFAPGKIVFRKYIKGEYDSIICYHGDFISILKGYSGKKTCWLHGDWFPFKITDTFFGKIRKKLLLKHLSSCNKIICVSNYLKCMLDVFYNNKLSNVVFLRNAIDPNKIREKASNQISDYSFDKEFINFVSVGRLSKQKGYDLLIPVLAKLHEKYFNFKMLIVGDGEEKESLEKLIIEHNANDYIRLLGMRENPFPYIKLSDVFICSSRTEGYSTSISEAIILGKCIISTDCGGSDQLLDYGKAGVLVNNNSKGIEDGLNMILSNNGLIEFYSKKSIERAQTLFDTKSIIREIEETCF